jgi:cholest-4-en-3-one 26-monooxygenase
MQLSDIDLGSHDTWAQGVPHDQLAFLRREAPVFRHPSTEDRMPEFWALTRHDDVQAANRDHETFSSEEGGVILVDAEDENGERPVKTMLDTDPPEHTRLRRLVNRGFTPRMVAEFAEHYHDVTRQIIDAALEKGSFDFVTEVAAELPLVAIAEILGVPLEDRHRLFEWTNRLVGNTDPEYGEGSPEERQVDAMEAATELYLYATGMAEERRAEPRDDVVTKLITEVDGEALGHHDFELFVLLLSVAGNETTRNAISHGLLALMENPDQMALLREDVPGRIDTAVEEIVRWATPVIYFRRTAMKDVTIRGVDIAQGDAVALYYLSANRDEDVFDDPFTFDITRDPNEHIGFGGGGAHFCLGANLARLELKIMFEELLARTSDIRLTGGVERLRSNFINGIKHIPVTVTPA